MILCIDDVCPEYIDNLNYLDEIHEEFPRLDCILFTIANFKNNQLITDCKEFSDYIINNRKWVTVGVHGYDHILPGLPPEQEREDAEELVKKSLDILKPFLLENYLYRPPGFQHLAKTIPILKRLGFWGIAYERRIKCFDGSYYNELLNCHLTIDKFYNPINRWKKWNDLKLLRKESII